MKFLLAPIYILKSLLAAVLFVVLTAICSALVIVLQVRILQDFVIRLWAEGALFLFGIRIRLKPLPNLPKDHGVLFIFNHQSHLDIPILVKVFPKSTRFGAKIELFKIPLFGYALRASKMLPIARKNRRDAIKILQSIEDRFKQNESFALAPEGTRQKEPVIGPFKKGPFITAANAKAPLVPIIIKGAHRILRKGRLLPNSDCLWRTIEVEILEPIETEGYTMDNIGDLVKKTRQIFIEHHG